MRAAPLERTESSRRIRTTLTLAGTGLVSLVLAHGAPSAQAAGLSVDASLQTHQSAAATSISAGPMSTSAASAAP